MSAKVKVWDSSKPAFIWSWSRSHYRKQENATSCHHRKMANDKKNGVFPALHTQHGPVTQYLGLQHCLSWQLLPAASTSQGRIQHEPPNTAKTAVQLKLPTATQSSNFPFSSTGRKGKKEIFHYHKIMKERSERALRQVKYLKADH